MNMNRETAMDMTLSTNIDALLARRNAIAAELDTAKSAIARAEALYEDGPVGYFESHHGTFRQRHFRSLALHSFGDNAFRFDDTLNAHDAEAWKYLMRESGFLSLMSADAKRRWSEQISEQTTPPLTLENIRTTFSDLHARRSEMFDEGVIAAFRKCSWDHKTNNPVKFGKKVIYQGYYCCGDFNFDTLNAIDDLRRVFHIVDGKPEPDERLGVTAILTCYRGATSFEDDYVIVQGFKNKNLHCTFKRPEAVAKLNSILAKHFPDALPAPR